MKQSTLLEVLETVLVVTVITALIWLYAEGETVGTQTRTVNVRFVTPTADLAVSVVDEDGTTAVIPVSATIQASRGDLPEIAEWIRNNETIDIEVRTPSTDSEDQPIDVREALNQSALADVNAFVKEVSPANVSVRVQKLQDVPMAIRIEPGDLELSDKADEAPIADPDVVVVTMPADLAELVRDQKLELIARLDQDELDEDTAQNASVDLDLPLELQNGPFVSLAQKSVRVKFIVRKINAETTLPRVQVRLLVSDDITGNQIRIDESQRFIKVTLRGPSNAIARIEADPSLVGGFILIKLADLTNVDNHAAPLDFIVPKGVEVVSTEPALDTVTYTVPELTDQP
jgi:hypothetical protein